MRKLAMEIDPLIGLHHIGGAATLDKIVDGAVRLSQQEASQVRNRPSCHWKLSRNDRKSTRKKMNEHAAENFPDYERICSFSNFIFFSTSASELNVFSAHSMRGEKTKKQMPDNVLMCWRAYLVFQDCKDIKITPSH